LLSIPQVFACTTIDLDSVLGPDQMRLPKKASEGDMPLIAFTSGCDPAECFLRRIGIDDSEFVPPSSAVGHVHFYTGQDNQMGPIASSVPQGGTFQQTYQWWTNAANLLKYDIIFNACECNPFDRNVFASAQGGNAYQAMDAYLNGGGRLLATHFYYNWFTPGTGAADLNWVALWTPGGPTNMGAEEDAVDQSFPRGTAFAQWLQQRSVSALLGTITLTDSRDDVTAPAPVGCGTTMSCLSRQWITHPSDNHPRYISFNTPSTAPLDKQCGRAAFSDVHVSGVSNDATFPAECSNPSIDQPSGHGVNEIALEFLFFELSSCIQSDAVEPSPPTAQ
jgi:hypothetical protein